MRKPLRVFMIDDNPGDIELTRDALESSKLELDLQSAEDGLQALQMLEAAIEAGPGFLPDLILLDLKMPKMDGKEVLSEIRRHEVLRRIPVVVLTSSDAEQDVSRSYELGANCFVTKPVGFEAFREIVQRVEHFWFSVVTLP